MYMNPNKSAINGRINDLHYPDEVRQKHLIGTLALSILLHQNNKVPGTQIQPSAQCLCLTRPRKKLLY